MRLIDEIEAAAKYDGDGGLRIVLFDYWPRIKAALEAGEEMADFLGERFELESVARFRAAAGEGS